MEVEDLDLGQLDTLNDFLDDIAYTSSYISNDYMGGGAYILTDGKFLNIYEHFSTHYDFIIAFEPNQIKLITNTYPTRKERVDEEL